MSDAAWLDRLYQAYDEWKGWEDLSDQERSITRRQFMIELKRAQIAPPARVLEIGFGTGDYLLFLKEQGFTCDGIERREAHNERLRAHGINATTDPISALDANQYDAVFAFDVFEHLTKPELLDLMSQIARVLKPGGRLIARFPNAASPFGRSSQHGDLTHLTPLTPDSFAQACNVGGLRHDASWNAAWLWTGAGGLKRYLKPLLILLRRTSEAFVGYVHFGKRIPLDPNLTVRAVKPSS